MPLDRLPETTHTVYAELLDQLVRADAGPSGSFVSKQIGNARYWYLQRLEGDRKRQIYLGRETPELLEQIREAQEQKSELRMDESRRREIIAMLAAGGMARESAAVAQVLRILADADVFRSGGVLVGTQAFACIANLLGVRFDAQSLRTADVDIAHDPTLAVAVEEVPTLDLLAKLKQHEPRFVAVPGFDPRDASTSFKVRGRDLRVDFLTPARRRHSEKPVTLPHLGVAAHPVAGLEYIVEETAKAAVLGGSGILVNIPVPARFALHKLWVSRQRPASERAKSRKDLRQAEQVLTALLGDDPHAIIRAFGALPTQKMAQQVRQAAQSLDASIRDELLKRVQ